jgi:hypothetical protein
LFLLFNNFSVISAIIWSDFISVSFILFRFLFLFK